MATTANSVVAFFSNEANAAEAVDALQAAGFQAREIGAASNAGYGGYDAPATTATADTSVRGETAGSNVSAKASGVWDKVKNFFEGESSPGSTSSTASGDVTRTGEYDLYEPGDVSHSLGGMNIPENRSRYFENRFSNGSGVLVTVSTSGGRETEAERILKQYGGDLGADADTYDYAATPAAATSTPANPGVTAQPGVTATAGAAPVGGQQRIQLLGEVLRVHKDRISRGEVRLRKEISTEQQTVQVPVTREELVIERVPVTGETTAAAGTIGQNEEIRIPLSEERASATTETFVREEVSVGKRAVEDVEEVGGTVRREDLAVEDQTMGTTTGVDRNR